MRIGSKDPAATSCQQGGALHPQYGRSYRKFSARPRCAFAIRRQLPQISSKASLCTVSKDAAIINFQEGLALHREQGRGYHELVLVMQPRSCHKAIAVHWQGGRSQRELAA